MSLTSGRDGARASAGLVVAAPDRERLTAGELAGMVAGAGWEPPRILAALPEAGDVWGQPARAGAARPLLGGQYRAPR